MSTGGDLPFDMIVEILVRLPTKSLGRFKCVSKFWRTFISDPKFAKTHLNRNNGRRPKLLISNGRFAEVVDIDGEPYVSSPKIYIKQTPRWFPICHQEWYHIYGSCHGLILAHVLIGDYPQFILLNPTTQDCKKLPKLPGFTYNFDMACGFGYDSVSDDYKVVVMFFTAVYVYSLRNGSWRTLRDRPIDHDGKTTHCYQYSGAFLNGCIHWIGIVMSLSSGSVINAFDLADEKFKTMPLPHELRLLPHLWLQEVSGCLVCLKKTSDYQSGIDVWVMKDYGIESSWTSLTNGNVMHKYLRPAEHFRPVFYLPDEELVLIHKDMIAGINVVTFNVKEKTSTNVTVPGLSYTFALACTFQDSLVSPELFNRRTISNLH